MEAMIKDLNPIIQLLIVMSVFSLLPFAFACLTSFMRFIIVFSILKTECIYRAKLRTYEEARLLIGQYIHFYNNERIQLKTKLTPLEKRSQYVA